MEDTKRITRLRALAAKGCYGKATIEGIKTSGLFAEYVVLVYDKASEDLKKQFQEKNIFDLYRFVQGMIDKGAFSYSFK